MLAYAFHECRFRNKDRSPGVLAPNCVGEVPNDDYRDFLRAGAVRAANEDEIALYKLRNPVKNSAEPVEAPQQPVPTEDEVAAAAEDAASTEGATLAPKHKGAGKWGVVNADGEYVAGDKDAFDSKQAAQEWIDNQSDDSDDGQGDLLG